MINSSVNFNSSGASNATAESFGLLSNLQAVMYSLNLLFCLPAHLYVLRLILTETGNGIPAEFFNLNLSVCEIGICLKGLIFIISMWFQKLFILDSFLIGFSITGRPVFQCLICVERYLAVVRPVTFLKFKPLRYRAICCTAAWIICLGSCLFCMFTINSHKVVFVWLMSTQLFVFLSAQMSCCVAVLRALKQSGPGDRGREREEENLMKKRAFYLILITTVTMVMLYGPFIGTGIYTIVTPTNVDILAIWVFALICFLLAGFVHPVVYLRRTGKMFFLCLPKNLQL